MTAALFGKMPTTRERRLISVLSRSFNRLSVVGSTGRSVWSCVESCDVGVEGCGDALVAVGFALPAAGFGVGLQCADVVPLRGERGGVFGAGDEVVAGFADVGVGAGPGRFVAGAVSVRDAGLEHFAGQPADLVRNDRTADRGEGELAAQLADRLIVGTAQSWGCERGIAQRHLWGDMTQ
jgi:hypothetical protein